MTIPQALEPSRDFVEWFQGVIENVGARTVVAVARGAVRFLQLHKQTQRDDIRFVSHYALPFLETAELRESPLLVFDDSVIFGSTMAEVLDYLNSRRVISHCAAYIVDRTAFFGESSASAPGTPKPSPHAKLPLQYRHKLWPDAIRRHHASLVRGVLASTLHHNLDFPTIRLSVEGFSEETQQDIVGILQQIKHASALFPVSWPESTNQGVFRYSVFLDGFPSIAVESANLRIRPYSKVRITLHPSESALFLTPVVQLAVADSGRAAPLVFSDTEVQRAWTALTQPRDGFSPYYSRSVFRLATAFISMLAAKSLVRACESVLTPHYPVNKIDFLDQDMRLILGEQNAAVLRTHFLDTGLSGASSSNGAKQAVSQTPEGGNSPALQERIIHFLKTEGSCTPTPNDPPWEAIGRVFLALRNVTDSDETRFQNPTADRLGVGLNFEAIRTLLSQGFGVSVTPQDVSLAVDMFVDRALVVPKITQENGTWFRTFYCGEDEEDQPSLQMKHALHQAYRSFRAKRRGKYLTPFDAQKLCVLLRDVFKWLPLTNGPEKFGYVSTGEVAGRKSLAWMTKGQHAPFVEVDDGKRRVLKPNRDFSSPVKLSWSSEVERNFFDGFEYLSEAFVALPADVKLLLSSCATHRRAFNAFAFELHAWAGYEERSFSGALNLSEQSATSPTAQTRDRAAKALFWVIQYIVEARKKHRVFHREYQGLMKQADEAFAVQGDSATRWWKFAKEEAEFDPSSDPDISMRFTPLLPLLNQMRELTIFLVELLNEAGWCTHDDLKRAFASQRLTLNRSDPDYGWAVAGDWWKAAIDYNAAISTGKLPGKSAFTQQLQERPPTSPAEMQNWAKDGLRQCTTALEEVRYALSVFCRRYDDHEFPFAPDTSRKRLQDGSTETRRDNVFMLVLDIIKGTNAAQTNSMKEHIRAIFRDLHVKHLTFEDTGNDSFIAVSSDPAVLWDAAQGIRLAGDALISQGQAFGGTRKGMYFGTVAEIKKPNGELLYRDAKIPNDIPQAFYILAAIDENLERDDRNTSLVLADDCAVLSKQRLEIDLDKHKKVQVDAKHYKGMCYLVPLA